MALVLVLVIIVVLFLLGVAVAGLSTNNARMVSTVQETTRARQAAQAALSRAQVALNASTDWTTSMPGLSTTATEYPLAGSDPPTFYSLQVLPGAKQQAITVESRGYLKNADGTHRSVVVMTVRYQRCAGAFLYPLQANGAVSVTSTSTVVADDIAIRTNTTVSGGVSISGSTVSGDILVGPTSNPTGIVMPAPGPSTDVAPAAGAAPMQPVTAPTLAPGLVVTGAPAPSP